MKIYTSQPCSANPISAEKDLYAIIDVLVAALFALDREQAAAQRGSTRDDGSTIRGAELIGLATRMLKDMEREPSRDFVSAADPVDAGSHAYAGKGVAQARFRQAASRD